MPADKWSQYIVAAPADKWAQYRVQPQAPGIDMSKVAGATPGMGSGVPPAPQPPPLSLATTLAAPVSSALDTAGQVGLGAAKSLGGHIGNAAEMASKVYNPAPGDMADAVQMVKDRTGLTNTPQKIGAGLESVGEFFVPGGAEKTAASKLAGLAPGLVEKYPLLAPALTRILARSASSGVVNDVQGHGFGQGAAAGALSGGLSEGLQALAPGIAEGAMNVGKGDRTYGHSPGRTILDETKGYAPSAVDKSGQATLDTLNPQLDQMAANAAQTGSTQPALDVIDAAISKAKLQNNAGAISELQTLRGRLDTGAVTGLPLSSNQTASGILNLKRGMGKATSWSPNVSSDTTGAARQAYGALDNQLDQLVPGISDINSRVSNLIPVVNRAESTGRNAGIAQQVLGAMRAPTGGMVGAIAGGYAGNKRGGAGEGAIGALAGLFGPRMLASPQAGMILARSLNSADPAVRASTAAILHYLGTQQATPSK